MLNILNNILFSTTINIAVIIMSVSFGIGLLQKLLINTKFNNNLTFIGSSYFLGLSIFLLFWRSLDLVILGNAFLSLIISLLIFSSLIFLYFKEGFFLMYKFFKTNVLKILIFTFFIFIMVFLYWVQITEPIFYFTRIGSLHTGDYALVSEFINRYNEIPTIRRNMAQMMLGSIPMLFGFGNAIFSLYVFLCFSILFMSIFILGIINFFNISKNKIIPFFLIFAFGSFSLSLTRVIIIDAGNPLIAYGYTDTLMANWFAIFSIFFIYYLFKNNRNLQFKELFLVFVIFSANFLYGSHNLLLLIPLVFFLFLFKQINLKQLTQISFVLLLSLIIALSFGGLLTLEIFSTDTGLGSMDATHSLTQRIEMTTHPILTYVPTLHHYGLGKNGEWISNPFLFTLHSMQNLGTLLPDEFTLKKTVYFILHFINANEILFFNSLRLIFWPLFAYITFLIIRNHILIEGLERDYLNFIFIGSFSIFISAYFISFFLAYYGMKWELSRFMMGGMQLGMLFLVLVFNSLNSRFRFFEKILFPLLTILIVSGPLTHIFLRSYENLIKFLLQDGHLKYALKLLFTHNYLN